MAERINIKSLSWAELPPGMSEKLEPLHVAAEGECEITVEFDPDRAYELGRWLENEMFKQQWLVSPPKLKRACE